ncbi:hypothetical protein CCAX7_63430 [Capsulimonas corticalis]|uniref:Uncharacterized protein n=2 Tax=Capsulimonas corticalis TaxID=2219043 RepID=A0A402CX00_9BACT|nr:hypothetical protein CCAX7_63430 [Capsulimonas corticalis]
MPELTPPVSEQDHREGPDSAPVTLVEYGDFECPYCAQAHEIVKELHKQLGDRLRIVFRNFPLVDIHPYAQLAAEAAEAAGAQGQYWEMHDTLYDHQEDLNAASLTQYAEDLSLDVERFTRELSEHTYATRVRDDFDGGLASGVPGTPTFFINGLHHKGPLDFETLLKAILRAERK